MDDVSGVSKGHYKPRIWQMLSNITYDSLPDISVHFTWFQFVGVA